MICSSLITSEMDLLRKSPLDVAKLGPYGATLAYSISVHFCAVETECYGFVPGVVGSLAYGTPLIMRNVLLLRLENSTSSF